ncbi:Vacuolar protein sorting-associated protein 41, partial [Teratosphaeriaceae sp. CCFEE 6253]
MERLRAGRGKGVRFEIVRGRHGVGDVDAAVRDVPTVLPEGAQAGGLAVVGKRKAKAQASAGGSTSAVKPGHCIECGEGFGEM